MVQSQRENQAGHRTQRRIVTAGLAIIMSMGMLAACGGSSADSQSRGVNLEEPNFEDVDSVSVIINDQHLEVALEQHAAPAAVENFLRLATTGFYDDTACHRLITDGIYILQCGDPTGTGYGGPGYTFGPIENAPTDGVYKRGIIAMARTGQPDSMGSQFFIVYQDSNIPHDSNGGYTVFGRVTSGLEVIETVADAGVEAGTTSPLSPVIIQGVEIS